jgi:hypothetical protein
MPNHLNHRRNDVNLEIHSHRGVGDLLFGMTIDEVRAVLGQPTRAIETFESSALARDRYREEGILVDFCYPGALVAVELCEPAQPMFRGKHVLSLPFRDLHRWITNLDQDAFMEVGGLTSFVLGVAFYCPDHSDCPENPAESVMAFERDHYGKFERGEYKRKPRAE